MRGDTVYKVPITKANLFLRLTEGMKGSGWGSFKKGKRITSLNDLKKGQIYLEQSNQFSSRNIVKITKKSADKVYAVFVDPEDTSQLRTAGSSEFVIWDFMLNSDSSEYYMIKK